MYKEPIFPTNIAPTVDANATILSYPKDMIIAHINGTIANNTTGIPIYADTSASKEIVKIKNSFSFPSNLLTIASTIFL